MNVRYRLEWVLTIAVVSMLMSCATQHRQPAVIRDAPLLEPVTPAGYKKIAPVSADNAREMLAQTAVVFRGKLKDARFSFDDCGGPRTHYVFSDGEPLIGTPLDPNVSLSVFGGPTPRGTWMRASELPYLALDSTYVVFLRNTDWAFSPVVANLVFRQESIGGRELLIDPSGRALVDWNEFGPVLSAEAVTAPVGLQAWGSRTIPEKTKNPKLPITTADAQGAASTEGASQGLPMQSAETGTQFGTPVAARSRELARFKKPALLATALGNERPLSVESLIATVRKSAATEGVSIGGRVTLLPYWRCWSATRTATAKP